MKIPGHLFRNAWRGARRVQRQAQRSTASAQARVVQAGKQCYDYGKSTYDKHPRAVVAGGVVALGLGVTGPKLYDGFVQSGKGVSLSQRHELKHAEVLACVDRFAATLADYDVQLRWADASRREAAIEGPGVRGVLRLEDGQVDVKLVFTTWDKRMFSGVIVSAVKSSLAQALALDAAV